jgi:glycosyltransferase involved in cell wall biosynthesis
MSSPPLKILSMLASPAPGGAEMLVRNLCTEFVRRGHSCRILFMSSAAGVGNPPDFERDFLAGLDREGISHGILGPDGFPSPPAGAWQLRREVQAFRPGVLHVHLARGLMARSLSGLTVPTVYTHHNVTTNFSPRLFRWFDRSVDRYVAIGDACRELLDRHVRRPIVSIQNGVPASFAQASARSGLPRDPLVLAVGGLTPKKDYPTLIAAAPAVVKGLAGHGRSARFAIAGDGAERPKLEALIAERGLGQSFELLGARSDVAELMRDASALANSSAHEGLPITLIEAALSGLPAVATDVGGNAEVVLDGVSGYVVPPARPDALAGALIDLLSDEARYRAFSEAAQVNSRKFTIDACAEAHLDLYYSLLS